jgi:hypothetical protein
MSKRDPDMPVLTFKINDTRYEILVAGYDDSITVRTTEPGGFCHEVEHDHGDLRLWGWIGRLMADRTITVIQTSPNDLELNRSRYAD